jgi:hypothetical protein
LLSDVVTGTRLAAGGSVVDALRGPAGPAGACARRSASDRLPDFVRAIAGCCVSIGCDFVGATAGVSIGCDFVRATAGASIGCDFVRATAGASIGCDFVRATAGVGSGVAGGGRRSTSPTPPDIGGGVTTGGVGVRPPSGHIDALPPSTFGAAVDDTSSGRVTGMTPTGGVFTDDTPAGGVLIGGATTAAAVFTTAAAFVRLAFGVGINSVGIPVEISCAIGVGTPESAVAAALPVIVRAIAIELPEPRGGVPPFTSASPGRAAAIPGGVRRGAGCVGARPTAGAPPTGCVGARPTAGPSVSISGTETVITSAVGTRPTAGGVGTRPTAGMGCVDTRPTDGDVGTRPTAGGGLTRGAVTSRIGGIVTVGTPVDASPLIGSTAPVTPVRRPSARAVLAAVNRANTSTLSGVSRRMPRRMPGRLNGFAEVVHASTTVHIPRSTGVLSASWIEKAVSSPMGRVVCVATKNDVSSQNG